MIPIDQTALHDPDNGVVGNCFIACVASIMEFPLQYVPEFTKMSRYTNGSGDWFSLVDTWLNFYGFEMNIHKEAPYPKGYSIMSGTSPRDKDILHSVVAYGGEQVFDPHPSRSGIRDRRDYITIDKVTV